MENELSLPRGIPADFKKTEETGLTEAEAENRRAAGRGNRTGEDEGKSTIRILRENALTWFNLLNLGLGLLLILAGSYRNMLFLTIVIANTGIAVIQELRARKTIRELKLMNAPKARILREGREKTMPPEDAVEGDLAVFRAGDQIIADGIAVEGAGRAMESLLTGESDEIPKAAGDWLYSGSYLTEGRITVQLVRVGENSYASRLTREARKRKAPESGLMKELKKLIRWDSYALLPLGAALLAKEMLIQKMPFQQAVPPAVAAMLGMIPEGLMLLTSMAMAVGVIRLGKKEVLVQELYGIETLARVDTLCLDKTGTLTTGRMKVESLNPLTPVEGEAREAMSRFLGAFDERSGTLDALRAAVAPGTEKPREVLAFSSARKKSAASFSDGKTLILGAPEYVLEEGEEALTDRARRMAAAGRRVLVLAEAEGSLEGETLPPVSRVLAMPALTDEMRPHVGETVRYFREQGVELKVLSGDNPGTVSRVAAMAGIDGADRAVDARELDDKEKIRDACEKYTVFGRVTPEKKKELVEAMRSRGRFVAMTGDGVNDIPALKAADCSIAMAGGADAARSCAQLTLMRDDFAAVPEIVLEGRRVINNITRSATLFLTKTIFSFLLTFLTLIFPGVYPFQPIQMSLVSSWTVGIPGFFLALEASRERIRGSFLKTVVRRALPGGLAVTLCAALAAQMGRWGASAEACSTMATWTAGILGIAILGRVCLPWRGTRIGITLGAAAGFFLTALLLGRVFFLVPLEGRLLWMTAALSALGTAVYAFGAYLEDKGRNRGNG